MLLRRVSPTLRAGVGRPDTGAILIPHSGDQDDGRCKGYGVYLKYTEHERAVARKRVGDERSFTTLQGSVFTNKTINRPWRIVVSDDPMVPRLMHH